MALRAYADAVDAHYHSVRYAKKVGVKGEELPKVMSV
jgi:hypothetical protein